MSTWKLKNHSYPPLHPWLQPSSTIENGAHITMWQTQFWKPSRQQVAFDNRQRTGQSCRATTGMSNNSFSQGCKEIFTMFEVKAGPWTCKVLRPFVFSNVQQLMQALQTAHATCTWWSIYAPIYLQASVQGSSTNFGFWSHSVRPFSYVYWVLAWL